MAARCSWSRGPEGVRGLKGSLDRTEDLGLVGDFELVEEEDFLLNEGSVGDFSEGVRGLWGPVGVPGRELRGPGGVFSEGDGVSSGAGGTSHGVVQGLGRGLGRVLSFDGPPAWFGGAGREAFSSALKLRGGMGGAFLSPCVTGSSASDWTR